MLVGLAIASTAAAQTEISPYLSLIGGYGILNDSDIVANGMSGESSYDSGIAIEGAIGVKFDKGMDIFPVRVEAAFSHQSNDDDDGDAVKIMSYMGNVYLDILTGTSFTPYIMGGLGFANVEGTVGAGLGKHGDDLFAGQLGAGVGYALTDHIILDLKYKYFATEDYEYSDGVNKLTVDISGHQFLFGVRYQF